MTEYSPPSYCRCHSLQSCRMESWAARCGCFGMVFFSFWGRDSRPGCRIGVPPLISEIELLMGLSSFSGVMDVNARIENKLSILFLMPLPSWISYLCLGRGWSRRVECLGEDLTIRNYRGFVSSFLITARHSPSLSHYSHNKLQSH